jgi:uncharacterized protein YjbI with pentapeptide repeats
MVGRLLRVTGTALVIAVASVTPVLVTSTPASADTVISGCAIVSNPTPTNFTNCPGAFLGDTNLSGVDLSYANLAGAFFVEPGGLFCSPGCGADELSGANFTDANLSGASFFGSGFIATCGQPFCFQPTSGAADLGGANLSGANVSGADMTGVDLIGANLTGATLTGANVNGTLLVPLAPTQPFPATSLAGAVVTWPSGQALPGATPGPCTPPSGSTFPGGTTTVTCQVLDDHGDVATGTFRVEVLGVQTTINLSSSASLVQDGNSVTDTATVSPLNSAEPIPAGGTVSFADNDTVIPGCSAVPLSAGSASCLAAPATIGVQNITATYSGSGEFEGSSTTVQQLVIPCATLAGCNLQGLNLAGTSDLLAGADLSNANLKGADLNSSSLAGANLTDANLEGADVSFSGMQGVTLTGANLKGANLKEDFLVDAHLSDANLKGASLYAADLNSANLIGANLEDADLSFTDLTSANLTGAYLQGVTWNFTTCPDGTNQGFQGTCVGHL